VKVTDAAAAAAAANGREEREQGEGNGNEDGWARDGFFFSICYSIFSKLCSI
jgi:hypothetical protein